MADHGLPGKPGQVVQVLENSGEPCRIELHKRNQILGAVNREKPVLENAQKLCGLANHPKPDLTNENPGATAIATGVKDVVEGVCTCGEYIAAFPILAMHWGALI